MNKVQFSIEVNVLHQQVNVAQSKDYYSKKQLTFTCSKSIIEILEKGVKYVHS